MMNRKPLKFYLCAIMFLLCIPARVLAEAGQEENGDFYYGFLEGTYEVLGRYADSDETYTGNVIFKKSHDTLKVVRNIHHNSINGIGKIVPAAADKINVLRVTFTEDKKEYEATYLIGSDMDNHGRLTGYVYLNLN